MQISADEVKKVARLARLKLTDAEVKRYQAQLSDILGYIDQLKSVETKGVEPTAQVTGQTNVLDADEVRNRPDPDRLLKNAPVREGSSIKVKAVFE